MTDTKERETRNPFVYKKPTIEQALREIPQVSICVSAGFLQAYHQRELLTQDERELIKTAADILKIVCNHL